MLVPVVVLSAGFAATASAVSMANCTAPMTNDEAVGFVGGIVTATALIVTLAAWAAGLSPWAAPAPPPDELDAAQ